MSGPAEAKQLREGWIQQARELDGRGYFSAYSAKQRAEVLRKGYMGPVRPDEAIRIASASVSDGYSFTTAKIVDELRGQFHVVGVGAVREALLAVLAETPAAAYQPPRALEEPPGYPYIFQCSHLGCSIYFKFQIVGTAQRRQVLFWSCHV